jgi:hypothetical protein
LAVAKRKAIEANTRERTLPFTQADKREAWQYQAAGREAEHHCRRQASEGVTSSF